MTIPESHLRSVLEHLDTALLIAAIDGRVEFVNRRFIELTGRGDQSCLGRNAEELIESLVVGHAPQAPTSRRQLELRQADGKLRWVTFSRKPYFSDDGVLLGSLFSIIDVSEQKQLELQFLHSQKMEAVGRLAGGVAHDFNNLLTAILGYSGLMLNRLSGSDPLRREIGQIRRASEQAGALVQQLLTFSRKQVVAPKVLNLNAVVDETIRMLKRLIGEDIELRTRLQPLLGPVRADPGQIQQIVLNLAINARDAMPGGGVLTIETSDLVVGPELHRDLSGIPPGSYILIAVRDTGCGMSEEVKAHLFEPFFTTKDEGKGTGLGLSTVYGCVKQSQGYIAVSSQLRVGTSFTVLLPRVDELPDGLHRRIEQEPLPSGTETVLLVEDEAAVRSVLSETLRRSGYTVLEAANGKEAIRLSEHYEGRIDLVVTDAVMPKLGGKETINGLCKHRPQLKCLLISGYTQHDPLADFQGKTVVFLAKPFSPGDFSLAVRGLLDSNKYPEDLTVLVTPGENHLKV